MEQQLDFTRSQLEYYMERAENNLSLMTSGNATTGVIGSTTIRLVAVRAFQKGFQFEYDDVVMTADVELRGGSGRILVDTLPRISIDIQTSVRRAVGAAENETSIPPGRTDVILTIKASREVQIVDGLRAGAAITVALIATVKKQTLNETVYIRETIKSIESTCPVGDIAEKALAPAENGPEIFLVPEAQSTVVVYVPKTSHLLPGWTIITMKGI